MSVIYERLGKLRAMYADDPEELKKVAAEEDSVRSLLQRQEYSQLDVTKELIALCRADILRARKRLATDPSLTESQRALLFAEIDARQWFLSMVVKDYAGELALIEQQLEADLTP
jgi:hypothetical protein